MFKVVDVISRPIYTMYEGVFVGTIINFIYDEKLKKVRGFFIFDDESESEHYIMSKNIYKIGEESILIKNRSKIQVSNFEKKSILNMKIVAVDGSWVGEIRDVFFDEKFKVIALETKNNVIIPIEYIIRIGQDIIIFDANEKKVNIARMKPATKILVENLPNIKVSILEESQLAMSPILSVVNSDLNKKDVFSGRAFQPEKRSALLPKSLNNPRAIIGKNAKETLIGLNGEIIVKKGQLITERIYENAKKHSKLFELANSFDSL